MVDARSGDERERIGPDAASRHLDPFAEIAAEVAERHAQKDAARVESGTAEPVAEDARPVAVGVPSAPSIPAPPSPVRAPAARPLLPWIAFALVVGAMAPGALPAATGIGDALTWWWGCGLPLVLLAALWMTRMPLAARACAAAAAMVLGSALAPPMPVADAGDTRLLAVTGTVVSVKWPIDGRIAVARPSATDRKNAQAAQPGPSQGVVVAVDSVVAPAGAVAPGRLLVRAKTALPGLEVGDVISARGVWSRDGSSEQLDALDVERITAREDGARGWAWRALERLRVRRELAEAYVLGWGDPPERADFRRAGLLHVLVVSGMHLVIAGEVAMWFLRSLGVAWAPRQLAVVLLMVGYTWLSGMSPSTVRALVMALAATAMHFGGREPHRLATVSLAALVLVAAVPGYATDLGFQLSVVAVIGIATMGLDLVRLRRKYLPLEPWPLDRDSWRAWLWAWRQVSDGLLIGVGATVASLPLIAWDFQVAYPWSAATAVAAAAPSTAALWLGLPLMALAGIWPTGPWEGLYAALEGCLAAMGQVVAWAGNLPGGMIACGVPSVWCVMLWPLLFLPLKNPGDAWRRVVVFGLLLLLW
jgi:ComEC/Rec2-related protein